MKVLSLDKMSSIEGGGPCPDNKYCPLARVIRDGLIRSDCLFARWAVISLIRALCTPCGSDKST